MASTAFGTFVVCGCIAVGLASPGPLVAPAFAQAPAAAAEADDQFTAEELRQLVAQIALYPDPLVALILPASTFPLDVVQAARFVDRRARDPAAQPSESWHESVRALLNYPEVVKQLSDDLDWTNDLGLAVANQQSDVLDAIQHYRRMALSAGNLRTDQRQHVEQTAQTVAIQPANPEQVYVPQYDPQVVVEQQAAPAPMAYSEQPYPNYAHPYPPGYAFTGFATGMVVGGLTAAWAMNWNDNSIGTVDTVNINRQTNVTGARAQQVSGGQRWQAQSATGANSQLRSANRTRATPTAGAAGARGQGQLSAGARPGDAQFGGRSPQQTDAGRAGGDRAGAGTARPGGRETPAARPAQQPARSAQQPARSAQQPARATQQRDAFASQGSPQVAQRDSQRGQASRSGGGGQPAATQRSAPAPAGGGARGGGGAGGGGGGARGGGGGGRR